MLLCWEFNSEKSHTELNKTIKRIMPIVDQYGHVNLSRLYNFESIPIYLLKTVLRLDSACVL